MKNLRLRIDKSESKVLEKLEKLREEKKIIDIVNDIILKLDTLGIQETKITGVDVTTTLKVKLENFNKLEKFAKLKGKTKTEILKEGILKL